MSEAESGLPVPGAEHDLLKPFEGKFRAVVRMYFGPGETMVQEGTMTNSFQLGGLYLFQDYIGDPSPGPWPAFLGQGYWGYNFASKKYEGFWIDNASSMMQLETGEVDSAGTTWTMHSSFVHPRSGETVRRRTEIRLLDADSHEMKTWSAENDGPEQLTMEIMYSRV